MAITFIFFYWPASQAIWQSFLREDAFGLSSEFIGFENYAVHLFQQPEYYRAMVTTAIFSSLVAFFSLARSRCWRRRPTRTCAVGRPSRPC